MDGLQLQERLCSMGNLFHVVLISAYADPQLVGRSPPHPEWRGGRSRKTVEDDDLANAIRKACRSEQQSPKE